MNDRFTFYGDNVILDKATGKRHYTMRECLEIMNNLNNRLYHAESSLIWEYSSNIEEDEKKLRKELYGDM